MASGGKIGVVLFNLGGPDSLDAVKPFLFNLFNDPAIIGVPQPLRWLLARLISRRRAPIAKDIYRELGGRSPILPQTEAQAAALTAALQTHGVDVMTVIAMRYWHPFAHEAAAELKAADVDTVVLLPLYPQYSTTTTRSSLKDWQRAATATGLAARTLIIKDYPAEDRFIAAHVELIRDAMAKAGVAFGPDVRLLFSAHGLPEKIVRAGDPYPAQVEVTAAAIRRQLGDVDAVVCYQSRVGPLKWIGPATDEEIRRAGREGKKLVVVPIAFVSEHSETLVELDIEYKKLAEEAGAKAYVRVPALGVTTAFVEAMAQLVMGALSKGGEA
jgi:ferrochelatase